MDEEFHYEPSFLNLVQAILARIIKRKQTTVFYMKKNLILGHRMFAWVSSNYIREYEYMSDIGRETGLYLKLHNICYELTEDYFKAKNLDNNIVNKLCKKKFRTDKFDNYFKSYIAIEIMDFLTHLWLFYLDKGSETNLIVKQDDLVLFVLRKLRKEGINLNLSWRRRKNKILNVLCFMMCYYLYLTLFLVKRGFTFRKSKKEYLISKETADGVYGRKRFLSDDFFIDDKHIKEDEVIFYYTGSKHKGRKRAFQQAKDRGYFHVDISKLRFNIKSLRMLLADYVLFPLHAFLYAIFSKNDYLVPHFVYFLIPALHLESFLSLYKIRVNITVNETCCNYQAVETIIFNKHGTQNILYHWSDLTTYQSVFDQYKTVNVYFIWGDNSLRYYGENFQVGEIIKTGFTGRFFYKKAMKEKDGIRGKLKGINMGYPFISFFDTSFENNFLYSEESIIDFLRLVEDFAQKEKNNILLKVKWIHSYEDVLNNNIKTIFNHLSNMDNVYILDNYQWDVLEVIAISDVCVSMEMTSPSTIAIILRKPGLYYDNIGNKLHPFSNKYKDKIVFDDKDKLFSKIVDFTMDKDSFDNLISEEDVKAYDEFQDGYEFERFCKILHQKCFEGLR